MAEGRGIVVWSTAGICRCYCPGAEQRALVHSRCGCRCTPGRGDHLDRSIGAQLGGVRRGDGQDRAQAGRWLAWGCRHNREEWGSWQPQTSQGLWCGASVPRLHSGLTGFFGLQAPTHNVRITGLVCVTRGRLNPAPGRQQHPRPGASGSPHPLARQQLSSAQGVGESSKCPPLGFPCRCPVSAYRALGRGGGALHCWGAGLGPSRAPGVVWQMAKAQGLGGGHSARP